MLIAYTIAPGRGDTDLLLERAADQLAGSGVKTCGTVQINTENGAGPCDMDVRILPDGPVLRISQSLGAGSRGCRLDPAVLETAVEAVSRTLDQGAELLIVNKFGKHEASGRGFRTVIAEAIERDIPVVVGISALNLDDFLAFVGTQAVRLSPSSDAIVEWFLTGQQQTWPPKTLAPANICAEDLQMGSGADRGGDAGR